MDIYTNNNNPFNSPNLGLSITMGRLPGFDVLDKFGANLEIEAASDPEDVWGYGGTYQFTADTGATYYVSSSDDNDKQDVEFSTLTVDANNNWNQETFTQTINGQTKTALAPPSGDPIVRIYRFQNDSSRDDSFAGEVYVYEDDTVVLGVPQSGNTTIRAYVNDGDNQTQMAVYTIPTGKVGFLFEGEFGMEYSGSVGAGNIYARCEYRSARYGKVFKTKKILSITNTGTNVYQNTRVFPDPIPAKTDFKLTVKEVSATCGVWGTFCVLLVDEDKVSSDLLKAVGQITRV